MKLCIDPGHGMSSRKVAVYDPGAVGVAMHEAAIVLAWAHCLRKACEAVGISVFMTRSLASDSAPLRSRVIRAKEAGCTHLISLHVNDADDAQANGVETLYRVPGSEMFARGLHGQLIALLGLRDRGVKHRTDLAVIATGGMPSALLELGFIRNRADMSSILNAGIMQSACTTLAAHLVSWEKAHR